MIRFRRQVRSVVLEATVEVTRADQNVAMSERGARGAIGRASTEGLSVCPGAAWGCAGAGPDGKSAPEERYGAAPGGYAAYANGEAARPACPACGKRYSNNSNLKQHILNVHAARALLHRCGECGKRFKTRQYMQIHRNSAHGVRQRPAPPARWPPRCATL